eukprot:g17869.t1
MAKQVEGKLCVARANGQQFDVKFDGTMDIEMLQGPDEFATLCDCLFRSGVLRRDTFLAALHRRRFEAVRKAHPGSAPSAKLADIFRISELATMTASFLCLADASRLRELSRGTRAAILMLVHYLCRGASIKTCISKRFRTSIRRDIAGEVYSMYQLLYRLDLEPFVCQPFWEWMASYTFVVPSRTTTRHLDSTEFVDHPATASHFAKLLQQLACHLMLGGLWNGIVNSMWLPLLQGRIYVCGGSSNDEDYLILQGKLYVCGGETGTSSLDDFMALDTAERLKPGGSWETLPPMSEPRGGDANGEPNIVACVLEGCLYVRGGHEVDSMERFDPLTHRWESLPPMQTPRYYAAMVAFNHRIYVCGGKDDNDSEEKTLL